MIGSTAATPGTRATAAAVDDGSADCVMCMVATPSWATMTSAPVASM
jgi:hypothetical protein